MVNKKKAVKNKAVKKTAGKKTVTKKLEPVIDEDPKPIEEPKNENLITQAECARRLGCAPSLISRWAKEGKLKRHGRHVDFEEAQQIMEGDGSEGGNGKGFWKEKERTERLKADLLEIDLAEKQAQLVPVELVGKHIDKFITALRQRLLGIPAKLTPIIKAEDSENGIRNVLDLEIDEALQELSTYDANTEKTAESARGSDSNNKSRRRKTKTAPKA